jgi:hypothetical protein
MPSKRTFKPLLRDKVTLVKKDGTVVRKGIPASVQPNQVFIFEHTLPIDVGDHLLRELPSGLVDDFIVDDPGFMSGLMGGIPQHFQTKVHRSDQPAGQPQTIINNIVGDHAKVNINSTDNSTTYITSNSETLFTEMLKALAQIETKSERENIAATIAAMSAASERQDGTFLSKYQDFIAAAANHMTILAPFLPALSSLLK